MCRVGVCVAVLQRRLRCGTVLVVVMPVVVTVPVRVSDWLMLVFVLVAFADVQPYSQGHQKPRNREGSRERLRERGDGSNGAHERCDGEVGAGARRARVA